MSDLDVHRALRSMDRRLERLETSGTGYEFGTYTPTYYGSSTAGVTTYTTQVGAYTRMGAQVTATGFIVWTGATGTGNVRISLPYAAANVSGQRFACAVFTDGVTFTGSGVQGLLFPNSNELRLFSPASNASPTELSVEAAGAIAFTIVYFV